MCDRWRASFASYFADTGIAPKGSKSLDRIDNNGGYWCGKPECSECGPCGRPPNWRWSTPKQQGQNRRNSVLIPYNGMVKTASEWALLSGLPRRLIYNRHKVGNPKTLLAPKAVDKTSGNRSLRAQTRRTWYAMVQRCTNPKCSNYKFYGAKGIFVTERWLVFSEFLLDMGEKPTPSHSIDRIDNDHGYSLANCRWATREEQYANRRSRKKVFQNVNDLST